MKASDLLLLMAGMVVFNIITFSLFVLCHWWDWWDKRKRRMELLRTDPPSKYQIVIDQLRREEK